MDLYFHLVNLIRISSNGFIFLHPFFVWRSLLLPRKFNLRWTDWPNSFRIWFEFGTMLHLIEIFARNPHIFRTVTRCLREQHKETWAYLVNVECFVVGVVNTAIAIVVIHFHRIVHRWISIRRRLQGVSQRCPIARLIETEIERRKTFE